MFIYNCAINHHWSTYGDSDKGQGLKGFSFSSHQYFFPPVLITFICNK